MSKITDAEIDRLKQRLGAATNPREAPYLTEVSRDAIRHWAWSTGDRNQLYLDRDYARSAGHGDVIGPPAMLYAFSRNSVGYRGGLPGVHSAFGGSHWKWHRPLTIGTIIRPNTIFTGLQDMPSRFAGRMLKQLSTTSFHDQDNNLVAEAESWSLRFERSSARERNPESREKRPADKAPVPERPKLSEERIAQITELYRHEQRQTSVTPAWASMKPGDAIPPIIRGPYSSTCAVAFEMAWGGSFIWAHGYWYDFISRHPGASMRNEAGVPEAAEAVHWDARAAKRAGVADAYDFGPERVAWMATLLTNWAGPSGFLSELHCEVRRFNVSGNTLTCEGVVKSLEERDGHGFAHVDIKATDQEGHVTATGWGKVRFPI